MKKSPQSEEKISKSLAKQAMVISVNGELKDLDHIIENDCSIKIFTYKNPGDIVVLEKKDTAAGASGISNK